MSRLFCSLLLSGGCKKSIDGLTTTTDSQSSGDAGVASFDIEVGADGGAFLLTAGNADALLAVEEIINPSGEVVLRWEDWYGGTESLTSAIEAEGMDVVVNWPVRAEDAALQAGTWTVTVGTYTSALNYRPNTGVDATIQVKSDSDFSDGLLHVQIVYAGDVDKDDEAVTGTEEAVAVWEDIYGRIGLSLEVTYASTRAAAALPFPGYDPDDVLAEVSSDGTDYDITLIIGETIDGSMDYYGVSGGLPGPLIASAQGAVVISWLANAGGDGAFSADDVTLYGATLAHEAGHYLGLFHVVETDYAYWDAIDDTPQCSTESECDSALGPNLMYPVPVCSDGWDDCIAQEDLSDGQTGVLHRYTGSL